MHFRLLIYRKMSIKTLLLNITIKRTQKRYVRFSLRPSRRRKICSGNGLIPGRVSKKIMWRPLRTSDMKMKRYYRFLSLRWRTMFSCAPNNTMDTLLVCSYLKKQLFKTGLETTISQNVEPLLLGLGIKNSDEHLC